MLRNDCLHIDLNVLGWFCGWAMVHALANERKMTAYRLLLDLGGLCFGIAALIDLAIWIGWLIR
jgi:hypothetical protein